MLDMNSFTRIIMKDTFTSMCFYTLTLQKIIKFIILQIRLAKSLWL